MKLLFINFLLISLIFAKPIKINLITTNDMHGVIGKQQAYFMNPHYPPTIVGGSAFAKYVDNIKNEINHSKEGLIILDGGNFFQGSPLGLADNGKTIIEWMNRIGYDALVPGSYDFISGSANLNQLSMLANFPFLMSNLDCDNCLLISSNIKPYIIREISGVNIGILGLVNSQLNDLTLSENIPGINILKEVNTAKLMLPQMKLDGAEVIILLTSSGVPWNREEEYETFINKIESGQIDYNTSLNALEMAYFLEGVDFIIAGGNSKGYQLPWYDPYSHTYVMQGYGGGTEFSHIKLLIDPERHLFLGYETVIDGKASQTLLADDFEPSIKDEQWINEKIYKAEKLYFNNTSESYSTNTPVDLPYTIWNFPEINNNSSIEIITWNCEFFPTANDSTILALAEALLALKADIVAFQEIRKTGWFSKLMSYLPEYDFIVSKQTSFMDLAIIFKNQLFSLKKQLEPFSENDYNFAGRPPLHAELIYSPNKNSTIPISIINLHMKCCDSGLHRRQKAANMLYKYINEIIITQPNIIVLGDWNDDTKDKPGEHCFDPFFNDHRFHFVTDNIAFDINQATYPKEPYISFLDHILVTNSFIPKESPYKVQTLRLGDYMGGYEVYEAYISDHRPVLLSFSVTK